MCPWLGLPSPFTRVSAEVDILLELWFCGSEVKLWNLEELQALLANSCFRKRTAQITGGRKFFEEPRGSISTLWSEGEDIYKWELEVISGLFWLGMISFEAQASHTPQSSFCRGS